MNAAGRWMRVRQSGEGTLAKRTPFEVERTSGLNGRVRSIDGADRDESQYELTNVADDD
jgi:hypothetical protein